MVSFPATAPSYTSHSDADGVPALPIIPILYVALEALVFVIKILDITAVVADAVLYKVAYVDIPAVPCICEFLYTVAMISPL